MSFPEFPKIPRLSRECFITEKIDGTNGLIGIYTELEAKQALFDIPTVAQVEELHIAAGSRSRWLDASSKGDNYGFAKWVQANAEDLARLGPGLHYGEWWGKGIQRNYGLQDRRFSLFNTGRWNQDNKPECCHVVPVLYQGEFDTNNIEDSIRILKEHGSQAALGFMSPEGIIIYHVAGNQYFKKTLEKDSEPKNQTS